MHNDSYFKTSLGTIHLFDTDDVRSVRAGYDAAKAVSSSVSTFKVPAMSGPWDKLAVIGHRSRQHILRDLGTETNHDEIARLHLELDAINRQYLKVGRVLPPQSVAA